MRAQHPLACITDFFLPTHWRRSAQKKDRAFRHAQPAVFSAQVQNGPV